MGEIEWSTYKAHKTYSAAQIVAESSIFGDCGPLLLRHAPGNCYLPEARACPVLSACIRTFRVGFCTPLRLTWVLGGWKPSHVQNPTGSVPLPGRCIPITSIQRNRPSFAKKLCLRMMIHSMAREPRFILQGWKQQTQPQQYSRSPRVQLCLPHRQEPWLLAQNVTIGVSF